MRSKRGVSPAKLLIILAVIAGAVAATTPLTLNMIKNANASRAAEDIIFIVDSIGKAVSANGVFEGDFHGEKHRFIAGSVADPESWEDAISISHMGEELNGSRYEVIYAVKGDKIEVLIGIGKNIDYDALRAIIPEVTTRAPISSGCMFVWEGGKYFPVLGFELGECPAIWYMHSFSLN